MMFDDVNRMAVELLSAAGADVVRPSTEACCGAHSPPQRRFTTLRLDLARRNIDAFLPETGPPVDFIATNIAGCAPCSASTTFYCETTRDTALSPRFRRARVRDVSEVLLELGLPEMKHPVNETVTYHDACHLAHAQKVTAEPHRRSPRSRPEARPPARERHVLRCRRHLQPHATRDGYATCVPQAGQHRLHRSRRLHTDSIGCAMHIQSEAAARRQPLRVAHPVELLHRCCSAIEPDFRVR